MYHHAQTKVVNLMRVVSKVVGNNESTYSRCLSMQQYGTLGPFQRSTCAHCVVHSNNRRHRGGRVCILDNFFIFHLAQNTGKKTRKTDVHHTAGCNGLLPQNKCHLDIVGPSAAVESQAGMEAGLEDRKQDTFCMIQSLTQHTSPTSCHVERIFITNQAISVRPHCHLCRVSISDCKV